MKSPFWILRVSRISRGMTTCRPCPTRAIRSSVVVVFAAMLFILRSERCFAFSVGAFLASVNKPFPCVAATLASAEHDTADMCGPVAIRAGHLFGILLDGACEGV